MIRQSTPGKIFDVFNYLFLFGVILTTLYPFLFVLFGSLSEPTKLLQKTVLLRPAGFSLKGYELALGHSGITVGLVNSLFYVGVGTALNVFFTGLLAYVLASKAMFRKQIMVMVVVTMFFSGGMIPTFLLVRSLGLYNTRFAILLPGLISAWNLIIMRTFFQGIPESLTESAVIDGAGNFTIFLRIIIPLSMPVIAVMCLFYGVGRWNSWFDAMIYLRDRNLFPLQLFLREILIMEEDLEDSASLSTAYGMNQDIMKYAFIMITTTPVLCLYPFLQRYFVKGVRIGALKG